MTKYTCRHCKSAYLPTKPENQRYCSSKCQLMYKTDVSGPCWLWNRATAKSGYGVLNYQGKLVTAHRLSYSLFVGQIPSGMFVCHKCDVRRCINPEHLFVGTCADNVRDMVQKCRHGCLGRKVPEEQILKALNTRRANGWTISERHIKALQDGRKARREKQRMAEQG